MIAACFAEGITRIFNANTRPEIADLGNFLNMLGANITVRNRVVEIKGKASFGKRYGNLLKKNLYGIKTQLKRW
jgi:UDP-N-acetylglucosamine 1-carboxyvinyltransferase